MPARPCPVGVAAVYAGLPVGLCVDPALRDALGFVAFGQVRLLRGGAVASNDPVWWVSAGAVVAGQPGQRPWAERVGFDGRGAPLVGRCDQAPSSVRLARLAAGCYRRELNWW